MSELADAPKGGAGGDAAASDTLVAVRNAFLLGGSLLATWSVALVVRLFLPRQLGPELFGEFNFADTLAANGFIFLSLGIDTYIQKKIVTHPELANDFFGGLFVVRVLASAFVFAAMAALAWMGGRSLAVQRTVVIFGIAQFASLQAGNFASLLYATRTVGRLAVLNVVTKLLWAGGVTVALLMHARIEAFAIAFLVSELVRCLALMQLARAHLSLRFRVDWAATRVAIVASAPYYLVAVAIALYAKIDISIMGVMMSPKEVGYYSSAANISGIAMLLAPLMSWVLMPQLSRAVARSEDELIAMMRRSAELIVSLSIPVSMMLGLGAEFIVYTMFGAAFAPAIWSLRLLSPIFVFVYVAMLASTTLILLNHSWTVTVVSIGSLALNALLNLLLVRPAYRLLGEGGSGAAAAAISVGTELLVAVTLLSIVGRRVFDRRSVLTLAKSLAACAIVVGVHPLLKGLGYARLAVDAALYSAIAISTGAIRVRELYSTVRAALAQRSASRNAAGG